MKIAFNDEELVFDIVDSNDSDKVLFTIKGSVTYFHQLISKAQWESHNATGDSLAYLEYFGSVLKEEFSLNTEVPKGVCYHISSNVLTEFEKQKKS